MLEDKIESLIKTIQENTAALVSLRGPAPSGADESATEKKADKKADKKATPAADPVPAVETPKHTISDIRAAAQKVLDAGGIAHIKPLLAKYGVSKISAADEARYGEVLADLKEALDKSTSNASVV